MRSLHSARRTIVLLLGAFLALAGQASAQRPPPVKDGQVAAASMDQIVQFVTATAYRGISLSESQRARARDIIVLATQEQQRLDATRSDFIDRRQVIVDRRHTSLRALLTSDVDRKKFDINLPELQP
jgi:hypothetical protein